MKARVCHENREPTNPIAILAKLHHPMTQAIGIEEFLHAMDSHAIIDVRAPIEFRKGHIPIAHNLPLFDDQQRDDLGVRYKNQGHDEAVLRGLEMAGPKMRWLVEESRRLAMGRPILLHCWRGGLRSSSVAWVLQTAGLDVRTLQGGYKAFRQRAQAEFDTSREMIILSGMTGAGKTRFLLDIAAMGEQVIDLEALANHRGSSFGGIGLPDQPSTEQFENELFLTFHRLDPELPTWLEDESPSIGRVRVPTKLWWRMRAAPAIFLEVDRQTRAKNLAAEYGRLDRQQLVEATQRLQKKLGHLRTHQAIELLAKGERESVALSLLDYYDKSYRHAAKKRPRQYVYPLSGPPSAERILELGRTLRLRQVS